MVDLLIDRCAAAPKAAIAAVCGARAAWGENWSAALFKLETLVWLAYCLHPKHGRNLTPGAFIPARLRQGITAPAWFTDYPYNLRADIAEAEAEVKAEVKAEAEGEGEVKAEVKAEGEAEGEASKVASPVVPGCSMDMGQIWQTALGQLQMQMTRATFDTWVRQSSALSYEVDADVFVVGVHNSYAKDWLEQRLYILIDRTLTDIVGRPVRARFVVWSNGHHE